MTQVLKEQKYRPAYGGKFADFRDQVKLNNEAENFDSEDARKRAERTRTTFYDGVRAFYTNSSGDKP